MPDDKVPRWLLPITQATEHVTQPSYRQTKRTQLNGRKQNKTKTAQFGDSGQASEILHGDTSVMVATAISSAVAS